jgi:hypothetical protein
MSTHEQQVDRGSFDRGALFVQSVSISHSLFKWKHDRGKIVCKSVSRTRRGSTHDSLHLQTESNGLIPCDCDMQDFELPRLRHHIITRQSSLRDALLQKGISRLHWRHRRHGVIEHHNVWRHLRRFLCFRLATHTTDLSSFNLTQPLLSSNTASGRTSGKRRLDSGENLYTWYYEVSTVRCTAAKCGSALS